MPMVAHQAVTKYSNGRNTAVCFFQEFNERGIVTIFCEDVHATITAIEYVVNTGIGQTPRGTRHCLSIRPEANDAMRSTASSKGVSERPFSMTHSGGEDPK